MHKKGLISISMAFLVFLLALAYENANGCSGNCNAVDPNNPNISSNGERIFLTGFSKGSNEMEKVKFRLDLPDDYFSGGAEHKKKIESGVMPCLRCHNFLGTGGSAFEHEGRTVQSANLVSIGELDFSVDDLKRAVNEGIGMDKRKLIPFMPRFNLTEQQLKDIKGFIKILPERLKSIQAQQNKNREGPSPSNAT